MNLRALPKQLFSTASIVCAYVGSGVHLLVPAALWAWMPSFLNRYYGMEPGKAALVAAGFVLVTGLGMVATGMITDRVSKVVRAGKWSAAVVFCLLCFALLGIAFQLPPGPLQLALIAAGMFLSAGACGPAGAMVANLTPAPIHGSAFATLTLANNLLGLAPAAVLMGMIADRIGLLGAMQIVPFAPLVAAAVFAVGKLNYAKDLARLEAKRHGAAPRPVSNERNGHALSPQAA
jgi:MFS family permease